MVDHMAILDADDYEQLARALTQGRGEPVRRTAGRLSLTVRVVPASRAWPVSRLLEVVEIWPDWDARQYLTSLEELRARIQSLERWAID